jgi:hypothetical protein
MWSANLLGKFIRTVVVIHARPSGRKRSQGRNDCVYGPAGAGERSGAVPVVHVFFLVCAFGHVSFGDLARSEFCPRGGAIDLGNGRRHRLAREGESAVNIFTAVVEPALQLGPVRVEIMIEGGLNVQQFARLCYEKAGPIQ